MELQPKVYTMEELESSWKLLDVSWPNDQSTWEIHRKVLEDRHTIQPVAAVRIYKWTEISCTDVVKQSCHLQYFLKFPKYFRRYHIYKNKAYKDSKSPLFYHQNDVMAHCAL